jgi:hypothetical protein
MNYDRIVGDRVRDAEHHELRTSEELFAADINAILEGDAVEQGVHFEVGTDKVAFEKLITVLGIDKDIQNISNGGYMNFIKAMYSSVGASGERKQDVVLPVIEKYGIVTALELFQSESWQVQQTSPRGDRISALGGSSTAQFMLMHTDEENEEGQRTVNLETIGIVLGMNSQMETAAITEHGNFNEEGLVSIFKSIKRHTKEPSGTAEALGDYLVSCDDTLDFPSYSFYVRIGKVESGRFFRSIVGVKAHTNYYDLSGGRFVRNAKRSGDNDDEEEPVVYVPHHRHEGDGDDDYEYGDYVDFDDEDYDDDIEETGRTD